MGGSQVDNSAEQSGAVYVFRRPGTAWQQDAYVKASNTQYGQEFGFSVAVSDDTLAAGAHFEGSFTGAVYIFH